MNKICHRLLVYFCVAMFSLYLVLVFIWSFPPNRAGKMIAKHAPRFKSEFGISWKLFTPPPDYNMRVYFITRNISPFIETDTIEVLEKLWLQKQRSAPFNQREVNLDYLVTNSAIRLLSLERQTKKTALGDTSNLSHLDLVDSVTGTYRITNPVYIIILTRYCKMVLNEKQTNMAGKEFKLSIRKKIIRPFNEMFNEGFVQKEVIVFETPFSPLN